MSTPKINSGDFFECTSQDRPQRLFFALWPEDSLRQRLARLSKPLTHSSRGRVVPAENLHITLAFLGNVDACQRECVERMADDIACPTFDIVLDHFGYWPRSRVLWFAPSVVPERLTRLADMLAANAGECGLSLDVRPYRPHLSLMRKVPRAPENMDAEPLSWLVDRFVLVRSVSVAQGVSYEVLREWPLSSGE